MGVIGWSLPAITHENSASGGRNALGRLPMLPSLSTTVTAPCFLILGSRLHTACAFRLKPTIGRWILAMVEDIMSLCSSPVSEERSLVLHLILITFAGEEIQLTIELQAA